MLPLRPRRTALAVAAGALAGTAALVGPAPTAAAATATVSSAPSSSWSPWKACSGGSATDNCAQVRALAATGTGTTWLGGDFTELRGPSGQRLAWRDLAALDARGGPLPGFVPHAFNGTVFTLTTDGTDVYAGGAFSSVDGAYAGHVARFDATGRRRSFASGIVGTVYGSALLGGRLYLGGNLTSVQGEPRTGLAALSAATGTVDPTWRPAATRTTGDTRPNDAAHNTISVRALKPAPDGRRMYVAGDFDRLNGAAQPTVAALDPTTGATDRTFDATAALGDGGRVAAGFQGMQIALTDRAAGGGAGLVLASGGLVNRAFRLGLDGYLLYAVNTDGDVQAAAYSNGVVYLGGHFRKVCTLSCYDSDTSDDTARLHAAAFLDARTRPAPDPRWQPSFGSAVAPYYYGVWTLQVRSGALLVGGVFRDVVSGGRTYPDAKYAAFPLLQHQS